MAETVAYLARHPFNPFELAFCSASKTAFPGLFQPGSNSCGIIFPFPHSHTRCLYKEQQRQWPHGDSVSSDNLCGSDLWFFCSGQHSVSGFRLRSMEVNWQVRDSLPDWAHRVSRSVSWPWSFDSKTSTPDSSLPF